LKHFSAACEKKSQVHAASNSLLIEAFDGHRWDSPPKIRFAPDSPLEEKRFELPGEISSRQ
jgi:hypothetical protein